MPRFIPESPYEAGWSSIQFSADQSRCTGQLIRDRFDAGLKLVSVRIAASAVVAQRRHTGNSDNEFGETLAPGASGAVSNDYRNRNANPFLQCAPKLGGRAVRVLRK